MRSASRFYRNFPTGAIRYVRTHIEIYTHIHIHTYAVNGFPIARARALKEIARRFSMANYKSSGTRAGPQAGKKDAISGGALNLRRTQFQNGQ